MPATRGAEKLFTDVVSPFLHQYASRLDPIFASKQARRMVLSGPAATHPPSSLSVQAHWQHLIATRASHVLHGWHVQKRTPADCAAACRFLPKCNARSSYKRKATWCLRSRQDRSLNSCKKRASTGKALRLRCLARRKVEVATSCDLVGCAQACTISRCASSLIGPLIQALLHKPICTRRSVRIVCLQQVC